MQLFYHPDASIDSKEITFEKEESRHIFKVLRKKEGDILHLCNGKGSMFEVRLIGVSASNCYAIILKEEAQAPRPYSLHLAVAPTKLNDRYEWFLEKATEIGITEITPIICDRSERKIIKPERYEKKLQSAMKQSLKAYLPKLNRSVSFSEFSDRHRSSSDLKLIAHCKNSSKQSLKNVIQAGQAVTIMIGPEGDFSEREIELALDSGFIPISLGVSRLRTETAAIIACHSLAFINEM